MKPCARCARSFCILSDFVPKTHSAQVEKTATVQHQCRLVFVSSSLQKDQQSVLKPSDKMGNANACQLSNSSKRNVRVFVTEKALEIDAFITSEPAADDKSSSPAPEGKKFSFRKDVSCVRVLASQTQEVPWVAQHFLSVFVEDEDEENICSKQIIHNMQLSAPITVLLYDV